MPGIGKCIALDFAQRGARVILACRSESRGAAAVKEIREKTGNPDVHLRLLDLTLLDSVREFAKKIVEEEPALHILVNNAAISGTQQRSGVPDSTFKSDVVNHGDFNKEPIVVNGLSEIQSVIYDPNRIFDFMRQFTP